MSVPCGYAREELFSFRKSGYAREELFPQRLVVHVAGLDSGLQQWNPANNKTVLANSNEIRPTTKRFWPTAMEFGQQQNGFGQQQWNSARTIEFGKNNGFRPIVQGTLKTRYF